MWVEGRKREGRRGGKGTLIVFQVHGPFHHLLITCLKLVVPEMSLG